MLDAKLPENRHSSWLLVQIRKIAMVRAHRSDQPTSTPHEYLNVENLEGVFYVGLGDQFDDERRLVREATSKPRSE